MLACWAVTMIGVASIVPAFGVDLAVKWLRVFLLALACMGVLALPAVAIVAIVLYCIRRARLATALLGWQALFLILDLIAGVLISIFA